MYYGLKQGQITPNIENKYALKLIYLVAPCSKITNTVLFLKRILHHFSAFCYFVLVMSDCPKVHFVALRFILAEFFFLLTFVFPFHKLNREVDFGPQRNGIHWYVSRSMSDPHCNTRVWLCQVNFHSLAETITRNILLKIRIYCWGCLISVRALSNYFFNVREASDFILS